MPFLPSTYSLAEVPGVRADDPYGYGWFEASRKRRAARKLRRASRKRKRGNTKAADRLTYRSGILKAKASGKRATLSPQSPYKKLWASKFPWSARRRMPGAGLTGVARGYRPSRSSLRSEWRGVVLGGLTALQSAGVEGYESIDLKALPQKMKQGTTEDKKLVRAAAQATGKKFRGSLQRAAAEIQRVVQKHGLESVAWPARALPMLGASLKRSAITGAALGVASTGTMTAAAILTGGSIGPQALVTLPAAGILALISLTAGAVGAGATTRKAISKGAATKFQQKFQANLEKWSFAKEDEAVRRQVAEAKALLAYQEEVAHRVGELQGQEIVNAVTVLAWAGGVSFALVTASAVVGHIRSRS
jgi:hypothetical protein